MTTDEYIKQFPCTRVLCLCPSDQIDPMGNHWCPLHERCLHLMRYGYHTGWQSRVVGLYAVGPSYEAYLLVCMWANDEAVITLSEELSQRDSRDCLSHQRTNTSDEPFLQAG